MTPSPTERLLMELDRRSFLRGALTAAGAVVVGSCAGSSTTSPTPTTLPQSPGPTIAQVAAGELPPLPRPTVRLSTDDAGPPAPFVYLPSAYRHLTYVYDTLLWSAPDETLTPWLATDYQRSPDGRSYTFTIRSDVRWHDGRALDAEDVAFSFEYWRAKEHLIPPWVIFKPRDVAGARATGSHTVEVRLERPAVSFLTMVASRFPIVPRHIWAPIDNILTAQETNLLVGSGPYRLESYRQGAYLFTANDEFFLGRPFVKRIEMSLVGDDLAALKANKIHAGGFAAKPTIGKVLARFRADSSFGVIEGDPGFLTALHWNPAKGGAVADVRFRQACAHAIDRKEMVRRLLAGLGHPGNPGLLAPGHPFRAEVVQYDHDLAMANRLLDQSGYQRTGTKGTRQGAGGKPLKLMLKAPAELASAAQLVVTGLSAVGVQLDIDPLYQEFDLGDDYEMALLFWGGAGRNTDPDFLRTVYSSRAPKDIFFVARGWANAEFDDLANRQLAADETERKQLVARMQHIVAAELPLLPLYYPTPFVIYRRSVFDDQWAASRDPLDKQSLVTGVRSGTEIRPTA